MVYIIGSGFSGLTTAYSLYLKGIKATILSPGEVHKKKFFSLLKYIIKKEGEINSNSNYLTKQIKKVNNLKVGKCKYILSHTDGAQSNIWGGVLGNIENYDTSNFSLKKKEFLKKKKNLKDLKKIIGFPEKKFKEKKIKDKRIVERDYVISKKNIGNLKKYLIKKNVKFKKDFFVKEINNKNKTLNIFDIKNQKYFKLPFKKVFLSCGPIETSKLLINSIKNINKVEIKETQHFYSLVKVNKNIKSRFLEINFSEYKFSCQLYSFKNIFNIFLKETDKQKTFLKNDKYFIAQCYLNSSKSGKIIVKKSKGKFFITGKSNKNFNLLKFKKRISNFNKSNNFLYFKNISFNEIGSSNHLGASFPFITKKKKILGVNKYGKLNYNNDIYITDSSVLNDIAISPITIFSMNNILRMILSNSKI